MLKEVDRNDDVAAFGKRNTIDSGVFYTLMRHSGMKKMRVTNKIKLKLISIRIVLVTIMYSMILFVDLNL